MTVYRIPNEHIFPNPSLADPDGLLGVGGDLDPSRVLLAYSNGIFPWYNEGDPILWFSPDPRFVLYPERLHVSKSLKKRLKSSIYTVTMDTAFSRVVYSCKKSPRPNQDGTWITGDMEKAYNELHEMGFAHSVEAWRDGELVGGLYGICIGGVFSGESMFALAPDASKVAFVWCVAQLKQWGCGLIDCQVPTDHLARFGAEEISREKYLNTLSVLMSQDTKIGRWLFDDGLALPC